MTLLPGTIISTGTPSGVGMGFDPPKFLKPGDVVECAIEGIGTLRNTVYQANRFYVWCSMWYNTIILEAGGQNYA